MAIESHTQTGDLAFGEFPHKMYCRGNQSTATTVQRSIFDGGATKMNSMWFFSIFFPPCYTNKIAKTNSFCGEKYHQIYMTLISIQNSNTQQIFQSTDTFRIIQLKLRDGAEMCGSEVEPNWRCARCHPWCSRCIGIGGQFRRTLWSAAWAQKKTEEYYPMRIIKFYYYWAGWRGFVFSFLSLLCFGFSVNN